MTKNQPERWDFPDEMAMLIGFLNEGRFGVVRLDETVREELRKLVTAWLRSGGNWSTFLRRWLKSGRPARFTSGTFLIPTQALRPFMVPVGAPGCTEAEGHFMRFILNPDHGQLAGPCLRKDCARYFLRKTAHHKVYCTGRCASLATAVQTMRRKRKERHATRVAAAASAIREWISKRRTVDWKVWVALQVQSRTGDVITPRTLSIWAKRGDIQMPDEVIRNAKV